MMSFGKQAGYPYLVTVVGVALLAVSTVYGAFRSMMVRQAFRGNFAGARQFAGGAPFGLVNGFTTIAVIIAIVGIVWLGLALRRSSKPTN